MSTSEASKPYIDATERSIELNFRSLQYQNDRLNQVHTHSTHTTHGRAPTHSTQRTALEAHEPFLSGCVQALSRNERLMHQRVWKMKTLSDYTRRDHTAAQQPVHSTSHTHRLSPLTLVCHSRDLEEPKTWQTRTDLQTYLGALAVMGRQKGGGRVFSKEKHSYFDHDDSQPLQQSQSKAGNKATADDGDDDEDSEARLDKAGKKAEREEEKQQQEQSEVQHTQSVDNEDDAADDEAEFSVPLGAPADISDYISERLQSRQRERTIDIGATPIAHPTTYSTRASVILGAAHSAFLIADEHKEQFTPRRSSVVAHGQSGASTPRLSGSRYPSPQLHSTAPRSQSAHSALRLHPPAATPASLDAQALSLVTSIHFHHSEQMRQLHYTGGRQLVRRTAAVVEGKNLFAGLKDKFHNTFTEIREMAEEDREDKRREEVALRKKRKGRAAEGRSRVELSGDTTRRSSAVEGNTTRRPATTASAPTSRPPARPTLPSATGFRPATSAGLMGRQSSVSGGSAAVERRSWPDAFALPDAVDTYTRLAPIVRLPRQGHVADAMQPLSLTTNTSKPTSPSMKGVAGRRSSVSATAAKSGHRLSVPGPITTGDLSALISSIAVQSDDTGSQTGSARGSIADGDTSSAVRPPSVYMQQQQTHMRANFIRFLSHTEPQLWTPPIAVKRRDGELASGRDRGKSRAARSSVIQTHAASSS